MGADLAELNAFVAVARARGFRDGARASGVSPSGLSEAVRRLEAQLGVRLLNRTTRSVAPTEAGQRLLDRLGPGRSQAETTARAADLHRKPLAGIQCRNAARVEIGRDGTARRAASLDAALDVRANRNGMAQW
jgi:DNA-binding transcriptional LysR family regulator